MKSSTKILISTLTLFAVVGTAVGVVLAIKKNKDDVTFVKPENEFSNSIDYQKISNGPVSPVFVYQTMTNTSDKNYMQNISNIISTKNSTKTNTTGTYIPIWWDNFDGTAINKDDWIVVDGGDQSGWGNDELQTYYDNNVAVGNGSLYINAKNDNGTWSSGRVMTKNSWFPGMQLPYGIATKIYFEAMITVPDSGMGIWPAFWAFPKNSDYGKFSQSGEIDIMELRYDFASLTQGIHYGGEFPNNKKTMVRVSDTRPGFTLANKTFIFSVEWSKESIVFFWNGVETGRMVQQNVNNEYGWYSDGDINNYVAPFDKPFYAIFNIAIGGNFPGEPDDNTPPDVTMIVDYFRVFADYVNVDA